MRHIWAASTYIEKIVNALYVLVWIKGFNDGGYED